jgi:hypothetical protein
MLTEEIRLGADCAFRENLKLATPVFLLNTLTRTGVFEIRNQRLLLPSRFQRPRARQPAGQSPAVPSDTALLRQNSGRCAPRMGNRLKVSYSSRRKSQLSDHPEEHFLERTRQPPCLLRLCSIASSERHHNTMHVNGLTNVFTHITSNI